MAKTRLASARRLILGLAVLIALAVFWQLSTIISTPVETKVGFRDIGDVDPSKVTLLKVSNVTLIKRSDDGDLGYYGERGGLDSSDSESSSSEEETEETRGTGINVGLNRANQKDDGYEGKDSKARKDNYDACVERGRKIIKLFGEEKTPETERSRFNAWDDLEKHGWTVAKDEPLDPTIGDKCLIEPFDVLKIPYGSKPGAQSTWRSLYLKHAKQTKESDGKAHPPTLGKSNNIHNPKHGTIVGINLVAPAHGEEGKQLHPEQITPMRFASDLLYLAWERQCQRSNMSPSALKYYLGANVVNQATRSAVRDALGGGFLVKELPDWPGKEFTEDKNEKEMAALVGSPIGTALGRMLVQRKATMGSDRKITSIQVWNEQPLLDSNFKERGPLLYMLFRLSDPAPETQEAQGPAMPKGAWSKPSVPIVGGQSEHVAAEPSFSKGSAKSGGAKSKMEDTLQKSDAQARAAGSSKQSSRPPTGSPPSRRSRHRRTSAQGFATSPHPEVQGDESISTSSGRWSRQRERGLPEDNHAHTQHPEHGSETVSTRTTEDTTASQANLVLRKLVRRTERGPTDPNAHLKPKDGKLPFQGSSGSSSVGQPSGESISQVTGYGEYAPSGPPRTHMIDSFIVEAATKRGRYWLNLLGTDSISADDDPVVLPIYDQGEYGYEMDEQWQLPKEPLGFDGLKGLVPAFFDAQGKPEETWTPLKWVHKQEWVDDEEFKHHPLSAGMFENAYSTEHRAVLYWSHVEPSRYAPKPGQPQQQKGQALPANRPPPTGSATGTSGSSQRWSDYPVQKFPDAEEGFPTEVKLSKHEGKQIPEKDLTPVGLPDTWMFDWVRVCKAAAHPVSDLKHVIIPHVLETHTLNVIKDTLKDDPSDIGDIGKFGEWPGVQFNPFDHNEPICGTPLGVSVIKLIVQRHEMFGSERTLIAGRLWYNPPPKGSPANTEGTLGLMFTLDDPSADLLQRQRAALPPTIGQHQAAAGASQPGAPGKRPGTSSPKGQTGPKRPKPGLQ